MPERYAAFISYSSRYADWVTALKKNLETCLVASGASVARVFHDRVGLEGGRSWIQQLQDALGKADQLILIAAPEILASPWVKAEWESFAAAFPDWGDGRLQVLKVVETPLPPFLGKLQHLRFLNGSEEEYRSQLEGLLPELLRRAGGCQLSSLPEGIEIPEAPRPPVPAALWSSLLERLTPLMAENGHRSLIGIDLVPDDPDALVHQPSDGCAAAAALIKAVEDRHAGLGTLRLLDVVERRLGSLQPRKVTRLLELRGDLEALREGAPSRGSIEEYLEQVALEHERLVPLLDEHGGMELLDRVYVELALRPEELEGVRSGAFEDKAGRHLLARDRYELPDLLELSPEKHPWVTGRWVLRGEPGTGKTTVLRHLARKLATSPERRWVPVYETVPNLVARQGFLFNRVAQQLEQAGAAVVGLPVALRDAAHEGRLLLLLDGLDEVPEEDRESAENLLRGLASRLPEARVVVTTRPIPYRPFDSSFREAVVLPLDRERRLELLGRWLGRDTGSVERGRAREVLQALEGEADLRELAGNPLYLTLMAMLLEQGASPRQKRVDLYDQVFELLLNGEHRRRPRPMPCQEGVRQVLGHLGYAMTRDGSDSEPVSRLERRLYDPEWSAVVAPLKGVNRWGESLRTFLDDLAQRTSILGPHGRRSGDWRFLHRTFREALTAERLAETFRHGGESSLLGHVKRVSGDESRWAEPYALLAGRVKDPDALVRALVKENRALGLRALATAQGLKEETLAEILELSEDWQERAKVYERLPELVGEPERALLLLDRLRRCTRNGNDLFFLDLAAKDAARRWPEHARAAKALLGRFYEHVPPPPEGLFETVEIPRGGGVPLWAEVPAGRFRMGSPKGVGDDDERPRHAVEMATPFRIGAVPVTNAQYRAFDDSHEPWRWEGVPEDALADHPAVDKTWYEAVSFCRWLAAAVPGCAGARLPLEEEWEYACRAGTESEYWSGDGEDALKRAGWFEGNSEGRTNRVGKKEPNPWGLYDVHGNVFEWTATPWTGADYSGREKGVTVRDGRLDPSPKETEEPDEASGGSRVLRGGSAWDSAVVARAAYRSRLVPGLVWRSQGFRVVLPAAPSSRP